MEPYFESGGGLLASGLGWAGLGWAGLGGLGSAGLAWAGLWAGLWAELAWAGLGWVGYPETEIGLFVRRKLVYSKMEKCLHRKDELPHGQEQHAISIYFFLEGLGFGVLGFRV